MLLTIGCLILNLQIFTQPAAETEIQQIAKRITYSIVNQTGGYLFESRGLEPGQTVFVGYSVGVSTNYTFDLVRVAIQNVMNQEPDATLIEPWTLKEWRYCVKYDILKKYTLIISYPLDNTRVNMIMISLGKKV